MQRLPNQNENRIPLGIYSDGNTVYLYYNLVSQNGIFFRVDTSSNGVQFSPSATNPKFIDRKKQPTPTKKFSSFRITSINKKHLMIYKYYPNQNTLLCNALSENLLSWQKIGKITGISEMGAIVPNYSYKGKYCMYYGEHAIHLAESGNGSGWKIAANNLLTPVKDYFGTYECSVGNAVVKENGILLYFYMHRKQGTINYLSLHAALFSKVNPKKILWQTHEPLWQIPKSWMRKRVYPVGTVEIHGLLVSYWSVNEDIYAIQHPDFNLDKLTAPKTIPALLLERIKDNPIIKPIADHFWESRATFNPAAVYDEGKIHIIYRAIGNDDVSTLGYASSRDGVSIDERYTKPIYVPTQPFETGSGVPYELYKPGNRYISGGGCYGGCEDPRITKIDDRFYMMYVAYDGNNPPRVALTSIKTEDFHNKNWSGWKTPVLISKPGVVDKNACVLPEKINGKYVIFHRVFPNILVNFVDTLDYDGTFFLEGGHIIPPRSDSWDSRKLGIGAPPLKTKDGWLVIYQAVDDRFDRQYKIGAMLLDLDDPTKVILRPKKPILEPFESYENEGHKSGVVYPCGSVIKDDQLFVYYGGADIVTCVATSPIHEFLQNMKASEPAHMERVVMRL